MNAFYNENDAYPAAWLRNLVDAGLIAPGTVDERSVTDLDGSDLDGFTQAHFFAGIGCWSHALRLAGWADDAPVWTGSCPCQPFSSAGKRGGHRDERHLWPAWFRLIRERRPPVVFGEQVASKDGLAWLAAVQADMEAEGYAFGALDLCAAGVGAPHIRQRIFFVADAQCGATERQRLDVGDTARGTEAEASERQRLRPHAGDGSEPLLMEHAEGDGRRERGTESGGRRAAPRRGAGLVGDPDDARPQGRIERGHGTGELPAGPTGLAGLVADATGTSAARLGEHGRATAPQQSDAAGSGLGFWSACDWLPCRDGKARPVEPGSFPLAHGAAARVGRLRAYGNAIVPQVAAEFIAAYMAERQNTPC